MLRVVFAALASVNSILSLINLAIISSWKNDWSEYNGTLSSLVLRVPTVPFSQMFVALFSVTLLANTSCILFFSQNIQERKVATKVILMMFQSTQLVALFLWLFFHHKEWKSQFKMADRIMEFTYPFILITIAIIFCITLCCLCRQENQKLKFILSLLILALSIAILFINMKIEVSQLPARPLFIAHRGFQSSAPENTLPAYALAFDYKSEFLKGENSIWAIETSVFFSKDCIPFLMHDWTFRRTTNISQLYPNRIDDHVESFDWSEIEKLDAGSWFSFEFKHTKVPKLQDLLLELVKHPKMKIIFNARKPRNSHKCHASYAQIIKDLVEETKTRNQIIWLNYDDDEFLKLQAEYPNNYIATDGDSESLKTHEWTRKHGVNMLNLHWSTPLSYIQEMKKYSMQMNMYTINVDFLFYHAWKQGMQTVTTNDIKYLDSLAGPVYVNQPTLLILKKLLFIPIAIWSFFIFLFSLPMKSKRAKTLPFETDTNSPNFHGSIVSGH